MPRLTRNGLFGTTTNDPLGVADTVLSGTRITELPYIASGSDTMAITLDPGRSGGNIEIVNVTEHLTSAGTCLLSRAYMGTSARAHASGTAWVHADTVLDHIGNSLAANMPTAGVVDGVAVYVTDANLPTGATAPNTTDRPNTPGIYFYDGRWNPPYNLPWGGMALAVQTTNQASIGTTATDVTALSKTFTPQANRRKRIEANLRVQNDGVTPQAITVSVLRGTTELNSIGFLVTHGTQFPFHVVTYDTPPAGSTTYKVQARVGASTCTVLATATAPAYLEISDWAPNGQPT
jgi:hypothetical protein